jgi:hypothetical protein
MKKIAKRGFAGVQKLLAPDDRSKRINLVAPDATDAQIDELRERARFFLPQAAENMAVHRKIGSDVWMSPAPILLFGVDRAKYPQLKLHSGVFDVDFRTNPMDGWNWIDAASYAEKCVVDRERSKAKMLEMLNKLKASSLDRCYLFGTGPSLGRASKRDWSDGYRVVCNTIVRDPDLWAHIDPHVLVAGDGIYHFGFTAFARAFRADLKARLEESSVTFIYPEQFHVIVKRELGHLEERLIPIPIGTHTAVNTAFEYDFSLPALGNVLNMLLLPVGCNLSKRVGLWGFDGRAPADKLFWSNSSKQSYTELLPVLQVAHPAFFDQSVPKDDPEKYVRAVHGDVLERCLATAEVEGWCFEMLHDSWTPTLSKRAIGATSALIR